MQQSGADNLFELARDFQGTILALIQRTNPASVSVVERYRYEPFGKVAIENASGQPLPQSGFGNDRFFLGRTWDAEVGLYDVRARWYEPDLGAFLAPDPLGAVDSWNFYQYGLAEPNSVLDPFGLQAVGTGAGTSAADRIREIDARIAELQKRRRDAELVAQLPGVDSECSTAWIDAELDELYKERDHLTQTVAVAPPGPGGKKPGGRRSVTTIAIAAAGSVFGTTWWEIGLNLVPITRVYKVGKFIFRVAPGTRVYRFHGGASPPLGKSWTTVNPKGRSMSEMRDGLGLPDSNTAEYLSTGTLRNTDNVIVKSADPVGSHAGGMPELVIPDPAGQIDNIVTIPVKPKP